MTYLATHYDYYFNSLKSVQVWEQVWVQVWEQVWVKAFIKSGKEEHMFDIKTADDCKRLIESYEYVIVDVYADWCAPCRTMAPQFEEFSQKVMSIAPQGAIFFAKMNIETKLIRDVTALPTFVVFYRQNITEHFVGMNGLIELREYLSEAFPLNPQGPQLPTSIEIGKKRYQTLGSQPHS